MVEEFDKDPENPVVAFYLALACILVKRFEHCFEVLKLAKNLCIIYQQKRKSIVSEYFRTKVDNIQKLLQKLQKL